MRRILAVEYIANLGWVKPLLTAAGGKLQLRPLLRKWRGHRLSDLAFAIDTRLAYLPQLTERMDEDMRRVIDNLGEASQPLGQFLSAGFALRITDRKALNKVLISTSAFLGESRALFENLADFYREFFKVGFGVAMTEKAGYEALARMAKRRGWATELRKKRNDVLHERSLWLAFDVDDQRAPLFEPILLLNWRPGSHRPKDTIKVKTVREIQQRLPEAAYAMRDRLLRRVGTLTD